MPKQTRQKDDGVSRKTNADKLWQEFTGRKEREIPMRHIDNNYYSGRDYTPSRPANEYARRREPRYTNSYYAARRVEYDYEVTPCGANDREERVRRAAPAPRRSAAQPCRRPNSNAARVKPAAKDWAARFIAAFSTTALVLTLVCAIIFFRACPTGYAPETTIVETPAAAAPETPSRTMSIQPARMDATEELADITDGTPICSKLPLHYTQQNADPEPTIVAIPNIPAVVR